MGLILDGTTGISASGNIYGNNIVVTGNFSPNSISVTGNVEGAYIKGDGSQLTNLPAGNYSNANVASYLESGTVNTAIKTTASISATGNVTGAFFFGDGSNLTNLPIANITGNITANNITATEWVYGNIGVETQQVQFTDPYGFSPDSVNLLLVNGNLVYESTLGSSGGFVPSADNSESIGQSDRRWATVYANTFIGDGSQLTNLPAGNYSNANVASYLESGTVTTNIITTGNITSGNVITAGSGGNISGANYILGNVISVSGNIISGNIVTSGSGGNISGANFILGNVVSASGNVYGGNISTSGTITASASSNQTFSAPANYTNLSEIQGGLIFFYSPTSGFLSVLQSLVGNESFTYTSYGSTYTTSLTTPFTYNSGAGRWQASAVNTGGSYVDSVTFPTSSTSTITSTQLLTSGLISATGNVYGGSILSDNYLYANGAPFGGGGGSGNAITCGSYSVSVGSSGINFAIDAGGAPSSAGKITSGKVYFGTCVGQSAGACSSGVVGIGPYAAQVNQGTYAVAVGQYAGTGHQGTNAVAIGYSAGAGFPCCASKAQGANAVAVGASAGAYTQSNNTVAIGYSAGQSLQGQASIAIGYSAGQTNQSFEAVAIGDNAGLANQGSFSVAIGAAAGYSGQGGCSVAIGGSAGTSSQGYNSVAIGKQAAYSGQGPQTVAVGSFAGSNCQGTRSVAVGYRAGIQNQGANTVAIGYQAGYTSQGVNSIAIGQNAGTCSQASNTIIINATGANVNGVSAQTCSFYVKPIRNATGATYLGYNACTAEVTYSAGAPSDISLKENIQVIGCALNKASQARGVTFNWKACGKSEIGVIAQEIEQVFPELVTLEGDGLKTVKYQNLTAVLLEAVKELKTRVETLEDIIARNNLT